MRDADFIGPGIVAGIFVPAYFVGARVGMQQKGGEIAPIILEVDGANELPLQGDTLELWHDGVPRVGVAGSIYTLQVFFIAIFVVHHTVTKNTVHIMDDACIIREHVSVYCPT